jgi:hypothetical protein
MPNPQYGGIQIGEFGAGGTGELEFMSCNCGLGYGYRLMGNPGDGSLRLERRANSQTWSDFMSFNAGTLGCDSNGCVGIGTTSPTSYLQIGSTYPARFEDSFTSGVLNGVVLDMAGNSEIHIGSIQIGKTAMPVIQTTGGAGASPLQLNQYSDNDVIIGSNSSAHGLLVRSLPNAVSSFAGNVTVTGTLTAGTVYANYQDVAEWVPSEDALPAGTVVVLNRVKTNAVTASSKAYDTAVAGVVSDQPGVLLGTAGDGKAKIATTGRVKVRVDARTHAVAIGDLLVTSDVPGTAMFSEPMDINGRKFHQPGTLIGKALEPLANGQGEILVLLSLQ